MLDESMTYAVIGASTDEKKYGFKVFKDLLDAGLKVVPVNPKEKEILGQMCYSSLSAYNNHIDFVIFAVPPLATEKVVQEIVKINQVKTDKILHVWMQPGSESPKAIAFCGANGIQCIANACVMIQRKSDQAMPQHQ